MPETQHGHEESKAKFHPAFESEEKKEAADAFFKANPESTSALESEEAPEDRSH